MHIEIVVRNHLLDDKEIEKLIENKLRPLKSRTGDDTPYGVYQKISSSETYTHEGNTKLVTDRLQLSFIHKTTEYGELKDLVKLVKNRMDELVNEQGIVESCFFEDENESYESESDYFKIDLDYMISYIRSDL